jgi:hypothetical protein
MVNIGVVLPQTELGPDVGDLRRYALAMQELGYSHVMAYAHASAPYLPLSIGFSRPL